MPMARPKPVSVKGVDGTEFKVQLKGDEFLSWYEDTSGNIMTKDADGVVRYSKFKRDHFEEGEALSKRSRRSRLTKRTLDTDTQQEMVEHIRQRRRAWGYPTPDAFRRRIQESKSGTGETDQNIPQLKTLMSQVKPTDQAQYAPPAAGSIPFPILIVYVKFEDSGDFDEPELTNAEIDEVFFGARFSVASYYKTCTYNAVAVTKIGIIRLTLPGTLSDFGKDGQRVHDELELPILNMLADEYKFDFEPYTTTDANGDRVVAPKDLCVTLLIHAYDSSGGQAPGVWGHAYPDYTGWNTPDGVRLASLQTYGAYIDKAEKLTIGLAVHEGAHARFQLPDLYDTTGSHAGLGMWSVMAAGSWGNCPWVPIHADGGCPSAFDPLSLMLIDKGLVVSTITEPGTYNVGPFDTNWLVTPNQDEFFVVQRRGLLSGGINFTNTRDGIMSSEQYDASSVKDWIDKGFVTSYMNGYTVGGGSTRYYAIEMTCLVLFHIDLSQSDNNVINQMLEHVLEIHGGAQNLTASDATANDGDPWDPVVMATDMYDPLHFTSPVVERFTGKLGQASDPPLKLSDGTNSRLILSNFLASPSIGYHFTVDGVGNPEQPDDPTVPSYVGCNICDKPRVYQMKTW